MTEIDVRSSAFVNTTLKGAVPRLVMHAPLAIPLFRSMPVVSSSTNCVKSAVASTDAKPAVALALMDPLIRNDARSFLS